MSLKDILRPFTAWNNLARDPVTIKDPLNERPGAPRYRGFHKNDIEKCIGCGACETICETGAIKMVPVEGVETKEGDSGLRPEVDYGRCCWCALCVDICSTGSLTMSNEYTWVDEDPEVFTFVPGVDKKPWDNNELGWQRPEPDYELNIKERVEMPLLDAEERADSFVEIVKGYSKEQAISEADRCIDCGLCQATCPAHMDIPDYIRAVREDNLEEGFRIMYKTNPLPEVCGRICTHKCEEVCAMGHRGDPIAIRWLKRYIADSVDNKDYQKTLQQENPENKDKKIAIVGAGPTGLSAAYYLALIGYRVKIFESNPNAGGMMRYGIPEYRLPYDAMDADINYILSLGVEIQYNTQVGKDIKLDKLKEEYDSVLVATGLHAGRSTKIPGTDHKHVYQAVELLREFSKGNEIPVGRKIIVIGGGNVAMDITRTLVRLQNQKYGDVNVITTSLETEDIMPADQEEIDEAKEENATIKPGWGPQKIEIENDQIKGLHVQRCISVFDENGRFNPKFDEDTTDFFEGDMVVEAIGQGMDISYLSAEIREGLDFTERGRLKVNDYFQSKQEWLFFGGDIIQGPDVIHGVANGHKAARGIDKYLRGELHYK
ncbi:MAG: FAD-dependent oxidoreductase [Bacteroidales bacterium]